MYELREKTVIVVILFFGDLLLKWLAVRGDYAVINQGMSLGIEMWSEVVFWTLIAVIFVWLYKQRMWLILAGGAANTLSRIIWGGVVDYWSFFGLFYNNLADYMIVVGLFIYGYTYFVRRR